MGGRRALCFATDDALGLSADPRVKEAALAATRRYGTQGGRDLALQHELEQRLAAFVGREQVVVASDAGSLLHPLGALSDVCLGAVRRPCWPSSTLASGMRQAFDPDVLETELAADLEAAKLVVAPSVHPDEGDLSPLPRINELCHRFGAALLVDETWGFGTLGKTGAGGAELLLGSDVSPMLVFGFEGALASRGVALAGPAEVVRAIREGVPEGARSAPAQLGAALKAIEIIAAEAGRRARLFDASARLMAGVRAMGLDTGPSVTPRVPVWVGDEVRCDRLAQALLEAGVWCRAVLVPAKARLVLLPQATHSDDQIDQALEIIERVARKGGLLPEARPLAVPAVEMARPDRFVLAAASAPHWHDGEVAPTRSASAATAGMASRVFAAVETLTWRATNLRGSDVRKMIELPRALLKRRR